MQCPACGFNFNDTPPACPSCGVPFTYPEPDSNLDQATYLKADVYQPDASQAAGYQQTQYQANGYRQSQYPNQTQVSYASASFQAPSTQEAPSGANASMVLGIISLANIFIVSICLLGVNAILSLILSIIGVVLGHRANKIRKSSQGTAGVVMNWIGIAVSVLVIIILIALIIFFTAVGYDFYRHYPELEHYW